MQKKNVTCTSQGRHLNYVYQGINSQLKIMANISQQPNFKSDYTKNIINIIQQKCNTHIIKAIIKLCLLSKMVEADNCYKKTFTKLHFKSN